MDTDPVFEEVDEYVQGLVLYVAAITVGARVTSYMRSPERNREVGGHPRSKHLTGGAIDVGAETTPEQRAILRRYAKEVDETRTKNHWHYQVDGRARTVAYSMLVLGFIALRRA